MVGCGTCSEKCQASTGRNFATVKSRNNRVNRYTRRPTRKRNDKSERKRCGKDDNNKALNFHIIPLSDGKMTLHNIIGW